MQDMIEIMKRTNQFTWHVPGKDLKFYAQYLN